MDGTTAYVLLKKLIKQGGATESEVRKYIADYVEAHPELVAKIDKTLTTEGWAADAKAVGELIDELLKVEEGEEIEVPSQAEFDELKSQTTALNSALSKLENAEDGTVTGRLAKLVGEIEDRVFSKGKGEIVRDVQLEEIEGVTVLEGYTSSLNSTSTQTRITESTSYCTYAFMVERDTRVFFKDTSIAYMSIITMDNSSELKPTSTPTMVFDGSNGVRYRKSDGNLPVSKEGSLELKAGMSVAVTLTKGKTTALSFIEEGLSDTLNNNLKLNTNQLEQCKSYIGDVKKNFLRYVNGSGADSSTERVEVYIPCKVGYVRYDYLHTVMPSKNADNWRIGYAYACNDDFSERYALTTTAEWECALHLLGASDFSGGFGHGDEISKSCVFNVDGVTTDISVFTDYTAFDVLRVFTMSDMFDPSDSITLICEHASEHIFDKNGVSIGQTIKWVKNVTISQCYLAMLGTSQEVVDTLVEDMTFSPTVYSSLGSSYTKYFLGAEKARQYSADKGVTAIFNVTKYPELPTGSRLMATDNGKTTYHKLYYVVANKSDGIDISKDTVWKSNTEYSFEIGK